jgi:hypothetical protein
MARKGLNCTLSYMKGKTRHAYRVRANILTHGMKVIYDESDARVRHALYPHRLSSAQFTIGVELIGTPERKSLSDWLASYADAVLDLDLASGEFPSMLVVIPKRNFVRRGVPLSGFEWGDHVGAMVFTPQITFETAAEPGETNPSVSRFVGLVAQTDKDIRYFYPMSHLLNGNEAPPDGTGNTILDAQDIQDAISQASVDALVENRGD